MIKLKVLLFIFFVVNLSARSQDFENLKKKIDLITKGGAFKSDSSGLFKIAKPKIDCTNDIDFTKFHVSDLNQDGKKDLIYSGICDPYDRTFIFLHVKNGFEKIFDEPGEIVSIEKRNGETSIFILFSPCCCLTDYSLKEIKINRESKTHINSIEVSGSTKISFGTLEMINAKGIVRSSPKIDDNPKKAQCSERILIGNHFDELKSPTKAIRLNKLDEWSLILYEKNFNQSIIGWINETNFK